LLGDSNCLLYLTGIENFQVTCKLWCCCLLVSIKEKRGMAVVGRLVRPHSLIRLSCNADAFTLCASQMHFLLAYQNFYIRA
jgi:hypothetical protein